MVDLSDGQPFEPKRKLRLYELDDAIGEPSSYLFYYDMPLDDGSKVVQVPWDIFEVTEAPQKPDIPLSEIEPKSFEWFDYLTWQVHQAALARYQEWLAEMEEWLVKRRQHMFNECIWEHDQHRFTQESDWLILEQEVIPEEITMEVVRHVCHATFQGVLDVGPPPGCSPQLSGDWIWEIGPTEDLGMASHRPDGMDRGAVADIVS